MKKTIYTIFDHISQIYWIPFFAHNDQDAMRTIGNVVNTPGENDLYLHPSDFELYAIGTFNDQINEIILEPAIPITHVCRCDSLIVRIQNEVEK